MHMEFSENQPPSQKLQKLEVESHDVALERVTESIEWADLLPNYESSNALLPKDIEAKQIQEIASAISTKEILDANPWDRKTLAEKHFELSDGSTLDFVGGGEAKVCYVLEKNGKKMAVLISGYQEDLGVTIPSDPKLSVIKRTTGDELCEYSDLRRYISFPVSPTVAVVLQEYGGNANSKAERNYKTASLTAAVARRRANRYIKDRGYTCDSIELRHDRHYLYNNGGNNIPAVIDVPTMKRI